MCGVCCCGVGSTLRYSPVWCLAHLHPCLHMDYRQFAVVVLCGRAVLRSSALSNPQARLPGSVPFVGRDQTTVCNLADGTV